MQKTRKETSTFGTCRRRERLARSISTIVGKSAAPRAAALHSGLQQLLGKSSLERAHGVRTGQGPRQQRAHEQAPGNPSVSFRTDSLATQHSRHVPSLQAHRGLSYST